MTYSPDKNTTHNSGKFSILIFLTSFLLIVDLLVFPSSSIETSFSVQMPETQELSCFPILKTIVRPIAPLKVALR